MSFLQIRLGLALLSISFLAAAGCSQNNPQRLVVLVKDAPGVTLSNVTVVLGDQNGTMVASGTPDFRGQVEFFNPPRNATVTAAAVSQVTTTTESTYAFQVAYDVNDDITFDLGGRGVEARYPAPPSGTLFLNIDNAFPGIALNEIYIGERCLWAGSLISRQAVTIYPYDVAGDGSLSMYVIGSDASGRPLASGSVLVKPYLRDTEASITVDQPVNWVQYRVAGIPAGSEYLRSSLSGTLPFVPYSFYSSSWAAGQTSGTLLVPYIPVTGNQYYYSVATGFSVTGSTRTDSYQALGLFGSPEAQPQDQAFDFSQALSAPSGLSVSGADTERPTFSWDPIDPAATEGSLTASIVRADGSLIDFAVYDVFMTRTSIQFPELPASLAAFMPAGVHSVSVSVSSGNGTGSRSSGTTLTLP